MVRALLSAPIEAALSNNTSRALQPPLLRSFHALKFRAVPSGRIFKVLPYVSPSPTSDSSQLRTARGMKRQETRLPDLVLPLCALN